MISFAKIVASLLCWSLGALAFAQTNTFTVNVSTTKYGCSNGTARISVSGGQSPYFFNWNNGAQGEYVNTLVPGSYNVSIVDAFGRDTLITIVIEEERCLVGFSKSFSPNTDGINDTWTASNIEKYPEFVLQVFNRWGQLVHQQKNEFKPWDGKYLNVDVPIGTYYYIFYYKGTDGDFEKGSITIMR